MDDEEIRMECIKLAQSALKEIGGSLVPLNCDEVIGRADQYYKFVSSAYYEDEEEEE